MANILNPIAYQIDQLVIDGDGYEEELVRSNAPVTQASWTCSNLPDGLTLSNTGLISGTPTTAGIYDCNVSVTTNWGTPTKTIRINVQS